MTDQRVLVTVGIPTFNRAALLARALASIQSQTHTYLEILISDNASTDATAEFCATAAAQDSRIRIHRQEKAVPPADNFNHALTHATGDYFMWLGDDDWIDPDYVEKCLATLQQRPEQVLVGGTPKYYKDGKYAFTGLIFDVAQPSAAERLLNYFGKVMDNGVFYGLYCTRAIRDLRLSYAFSGDWHFVAGALLSGGFTMLCDTSIHRELGGASSSYAKLVRAHGLPPRARWFPSFNTARAASKYFRRASEFVALKDSTRLRHRIVLVLLLRPLTNFPFRIRRKLKLTWAKFR